MVFHPVLCHSAYLTCSKGIAASLRLCERNMTRYLIASGVYPDVGSKSITDIYALCVFQFPVSGCERIRLRGQSSHGAQIYDVSWKLTSKQFVYVCANLALSTSSSHAKILNTYNKALGKYKLAISFRYCWSMRRWQNFAENALWLYY